MCESNLTRASYRAGRVALENARADGCSDLVWLSHIVARALVRRGLSERLAHKTAFALVMRSFDFEREVVR